MNCKNCNHKILETARFCAHCGAKVVTERIAIRKLLSNFASDFFGWDNKYLVTLKELLVSPERVLHDYLNGVRKRYISPFTFLAIGTALAMLAFTLFSDKYIQVSSSFQEKQFEFIQDKNSYSIKISFLMLFKFIGIMIVVFVLLVVSGKIVEALT